MTLEIADQNKIQNTGLFNPAEILKSISVIETDKIPPDTKYHWKTRDLCLSLAGNKNAMMECSKDLERFCRRKVKDVDPNKIAEDIWKIGSDIIVQTAEIMIFAKAFQSSLKVGDL